MVRQLFRDHVPDFDCLLVQREKKAGAIVVGKTNVPEFGFGSQTFNPVFGATRNPHDLTKTCGGSTGGGSVAVACGMVPLADGSDHGGSLRNPPSFCGVVGLRPSPGRVPNTPAKLGWQPFSVAGPVARNVSDCAFFLSVLAGFDRVSPIAIDETGSAIRAAAGARLQRRARGDVQGFGFAVGSAGEGGGAGADEDARITWLHRGRSRAGSCAMRTSVCWRGGIGRTSKPLGI